MELFFFLFPGSPNSNDQFSQESKKMDWGRGSSVRCFIIHNRTENMFSHQVSAHKHMTAGTLVFLQRWTGLSSPGRNPVSAALPGLPPSYMRRLTPSPGFTTKSGPILLPWPLTDPLSDGSFCSTFSSHLPTQGCTSVCVCCQPVYRHVSESGSKGWVQKQSGILSCCFDFIPHI